MPAYLIVLLIALSAVGSLVFSTLSYSLREMSRVRLVDFLQRAGSASGPSRPSSTRAT